MQMLEQLDPDQMMKTAAQATLHLLAQMNTIDDEKYDQASIRIILEE